MACRASATPAASDCAANHHDRIRAYLAEEEAFHAERGFELKPGNRSFALLHDEPSPHGVVLLYHGFNAGPGIWRSGAGFGGAEAPAQGTAERIFDLGPDVFAPNLLGHGVLREGQEDRSLLPGLRTAHEWGVFKDRMFDLVRDAGQVRAVGHSFGGALALWTQATHADARNPDGTPIARKAIGVMPLVELEGDYAIAGKTLRWGPIGLRNQSVARAMQRLGTWLPGPVDKLLTKMKVPMRRTLPPDLPYGGQHVDQSNVLALTIVSEAMRAESSRLRALPEGVTLIGSRFDSRVSADAIAHLGASVGARTVMLDRAETVGHGAVAPREVPREAYQRTQNLLLEDLAASLVPRDSWAHDA